MSQKTFRLGLTEGKAGDAVSVYTNCFEMSSVCDKVFQHYHVEFPGNDKILKSRDRCLEIIDRLQIQHPELFTPRAAYDGRHNLYRTTPLELSNNSAEFRVFMRPKPNLNQQSQGGIVVKVVKVATIDPNCLVDVINRRVAHTSDSLTTVTFLNILVRMKAILTYPSNKASFFTKEQRESLGGGLQIWRGLFQSVRPSIGRLLVNVDTSVAVMYRDGALLDLVMEFMELRDVRGLTPTNFKGPQHKRLNEFLKNLIVSSNVPASSTSEAPRWKKITSIVMVGADDFKFSYDKANGDEITITEYYRSTYNYRIQYGKIVCISIRRDNSVIFPLEILKVKPGQFYKKTLPPKMTAKALEFSSQKPDVRIKALEGSRDLLGYDDSDFLRQSGVSVRPQLLTVNGRILNPPPLMWGQNNQRKPQEIPRGGVWNLADKTFFAPGRIQAWSVIVYDTRPAIMSEGYKTLRNFLTGFVNCCCTLGMSFPRTPPQIIPGRPGSGDQGYHQDMDQAAGAAMETHKDQFDPKTGPPRPTFILVILPEAAMDIYISIKNWGDIVRGCPTQCVKSGKLFKPNNSYFSNLALKLNVKVDGVSSVPGTSPLKTNLSKVPTMIVGMDVSHSTGSSRPSVAGLVASMDEHFTQYSAVTTIQPPLREIIEDIDVMIEQALQNFHGFWRKRGQSVLPQRIILYRDGVSEGQFEQVETLELKKIKDALTNIWKTQKFSGNVPSVTFIIVGKKHHIRFFPKDNRNRDRSGNCPAGMVVDRDICSPTDYDFYLQSHSGILGTSRPSHYSVVLDENNLGADQLQALSYMLCYTYGRATRSVSIPAPVYYADIICARGRIHSALIHDESDTSSAVGNNSLEDHKKAFKPVADFLKRKMYFM